MDRELWDLIFDAIKRAAKEVGWHGGRRLPVYGNWLIVAMYIWSVWHDRPLSWACDRFHYGRLFRPRSLPSVSQFTRRVKSDDCQQILRLVHEEFSQRGLCCEEGYIDGKPLLVSPVSKDRQAKRGKISGGYGKGYKLHAYVNEHRRIVVWSVTSLNEDEKTVARESLLPNLPELSPRAIVMADSNYDSAPLHKEVTEPREICFVHRLRGQDRVGPAGHNPQTWREMGVSRRELVQAWQNHEQLLEFLLKNRDEIERSFGVLTCTGGGLGTALPSWVRTLDRVTRWVGAKIILYNARLKVKETRASTEAA
jgi:hypothetical protein